MIVTETNGTKVYRPENDKDRKQLKSMFPGRSKFIQYPQMHQSYPPTNNRGTTKGRTYKFVEIKRRIGSAAHAVRERLISTGRFKKMFAKREL